MKKKLLILLIMAFMATAVTACKPQNGSETSTSTDSSSDLPMESFAELEDFTLGFGEKKTLTAKGENLIWSSSDNSIATVSQNGEVFAVGVGEATISVTNGVETVSCKILVTQSNTVPSCALDLSKRTIAIGKTITIIPEITVAGVVLEHADIFYESEDPTKATVDANGVVTAVAFGETKIFVTYSAGGYFDTLEVPVSVVEDIQFEINQTAVTLAVLEVEGGTYSSQAEVGVSQLKVNGTSIDFSEVTFSIADETIATIKDGVITSKKVGETTLTATYQSELSTVTIEIPVSVVRERKVIAEKGRVDVSWDATKANPATYAYIELPISLQVTDEEVVAISNKMGAILSENNGLTVPKSSLDAGEKTFSIATETLIYELTVAVENSLAQITDYSVQFDNAMGVQATALDETMDGRDDVVKAVSPTSGDGGVWYNHNGYVRFGFEQGRCVFIYEVKAEEGTPIGGYFADGTSAGYTDFDLNTSTMKFSSPYVKVVNADFEETKFVFGKWNTVVIDFTQIGTEDFSTIFIPSFTNTDLSKQYTAYYSNFRYMTKALYEQLKNPTAEKKYTVSFETGNSELNFDDQEVSYRGRVDVPEIDDGYNFIGWYVDGKLIDLEKLYVTSDITVQAVYDKEYQYTIKHFQREINGSYKLVETEVLEGKMADLVTATPKTYPGYTYNEALSVVSGYIEAEDKLVLACYYENNSYTFQSQEIGGHANLSISEKIMEDVPVEDLRGNTYFYKKTTANGNTMNTFTYTAKDLGKYLVFNVYYTKIPTQMGVVVWGNTSDTPTAYDSIIGYYDANGKLMNSEGDALNNWMSIVIYLDEDVFLSSETSFHISLCSWSANELYYGEYTFLTEQQFKSYFEITGTLQNLPTGVTSYKGELLESIGAINSLTDSFNGKKTYVSQKAYHFSSCGVKINGITSWTADQYVAVRVYSDSIMGKHLLEDAYIGEQVAVYDDDGNIVEGEDIKANTWYTYVYKPGAQTIGQYAGCFLVNVAYEDGVKVTFDCIYVMENETAYTAFKTWKGWND